MDVKCGVCVCVCVCVVTALKSRSLSSSSGRSTKMSLQKLIQAQRLHIPKIKVIVMILAKKNRE